MAVLKQLMREQSSSDHQLLLGMSSCVILKQIKRRMSVQRYAFLHDAATTSSNLDIFSSPRPNADETASNPLEPLKGKHHADPPDIVSCITPCSRVQSGHLVSSFCEGTANERYSLLVNVVSALNETVWLSGMHFIGAYIPWNLI